jgi:hypothetical protein
VRGLAVVVATIGASLMWTAPAHAEVNELCRFDGERLSEISGLATSALHEGIVWAHNDSGGGPFLYALDIDTCEIRSTLKVRGIDALDPEAIAVGTGASGAPVIWWGDIGDNTAERAYVEIHEITEPGDLTDGIATSTTYRIRLDQAEDAEAMLADGDRLWLIGKGLTGGTIWRLPAPLSVGEATRADAVGAEDALVTDASMRPGGGYAVRDYSEVRIYSGQPAGTLIERMPLPEQIQGEAMTWTADGTGLIVASEGDNRLLLVPVTAPVETALPQASDTSAEPTLSPSSDPTDWPSSEAGPDVSITPSPVADALAPVDRVGSLAVIALAIGAVVFVVSAAAVPLIARMRSRH